MNPTCITSSENHLLDVLTASNTQQLEIPSGQIILVTQVWAHAALLYLSIVVSGWQPANPNVQFHVSQIIQLLRHRISPPEQLRTVVWPFCVAGCLAEPAQEADLRAMAEALQPPSIFGTVRKALEIMENAWRNKDKGDHANHDLATFFRGQGGLVLLI